MRDGSSDLYERDFLAWTRAQVAALRRLAAMRPNEQLDYPHLIEEIGDLGRSERDAVRSHVRTIIEHCLKLQHSAAAEPRPGWMSRIGRTRAELEDKLSASLRRDLRLQLPRLYAQARRNLARDLALFGEPEAAARLPETCPYRLDELLRDDWYPAG
jgi:ABC-type hemin transport system ATPase subunit